MKMINLAKFEIGIKDKYTVDWWPNKKHGGKHHATAASHGHDDQLVVTMNGYNLARLFFSSTTRIKLEPFCRSDSSQELWTYLGDLKKAIVDGNVNWTSGNLNVVSTVLIGLGQNVESTVTA